MRAGLGVAGALGVAALVLATFATVIQIRVGTVDRLSGMETSFSGWDRHGPALLLLGAVAALMLLGGIRGARPAMAATAALGLVALLIAVATDLPDAGQTGQVGQLYADARAEPGLGFFAETLGGVLLLVAGGGLLILAGGGGRPAGVTRGRARRRERAPRPERASGS